MKVSIFYFSGTGNTWWVSKQLKSIFNEKKHHAEIYSIEKKEVDWTNSLKTILDDSDLIGVGYPVYSSSIPKIMKEWVKENLCKYSNGIDQEIKAFVFDTMAMFSGDTPLRMRKILRKCNYSVRQAINIRMLSNLPQMPSLMTWDEERQNEILEKAEKKCEKLVNKILKDKKWLMRRDPFSRLIGWIQRIGLRLEGKKIKKLYEIDEDKCIMCEKCVRFCPVNNLSIEEGPDASHIIFGDDCVYCMRCFNYCLEDAIIIMDRTRDTKRYRRFRGQIPNFKLSKVKN